MKEVADRIEKSDFLQSDFSEAQETPISHYGSMPISQESSGSAPQRGFCIPVKIKLHEDVSIAGLNRLHTSCL